MSLLLLFRNWALGTVPVTLARWRRNSLVLGPRYPSRQDTTGVVWYASMRDRRVLTQFSGVTIAAEVTLGARAGQVVFQDTVGVKPPNTALIDLTPVAAPAISPNGGSFTTADFVSITDATSGATIYYTVDGSTPTIASTLYVGPFTLSAGSITVKAFAVKTGMSDSTVTSATFTVSAVTGGWMAAYDFTTAACLNIVTSGSPYLLGAMTGSVAANPLLPYSAAGGYAGGKLGSAVTTTYVTRSTGSRPGGGTFDRVTVAMFIKNNADYVGAGDLGPLWRLSDVSGGGANYFLSLSNGAEFNGSAIAGGNPQLAIDGAWHHYAWLLDGTRFKIYKDGVLIVDQPQVASAIPAECVIVENRRTTAGSIDFDNVCVYGGSALSADVIALLAAGHLPNAAGIVT